ncbi:MAG: hypothetical protein R3F14_44515, partial [Polyangiaceae bacterium]
MSTTTEAHEGHDAHDAPEAKPPKEPFGASIAVLFSPDRGMQRQVRVGRARFYFLFAWASSIALGVVTAVRVDARSSTLKQLEMMGQLRSMSERQIAEETQSGERVAMVTSIAKAVVGTPVGLGMACLAVVVLVWFFRGRIKGSAVAPVAAATLVPGALANLVDAVAAYRHALIPPEGVPLGPRTLTAVMQLFHKPLMGAAMKFGNA